MREFRKAQAEDAEDIAKLYAELNTSPSISVLPERITEIAADANTYLIVCDDGEDLLATALISLCNDVMFNRQPFAIVDNFVVASHYQREGIGKSLMDHIEEFCLARDCSKIMLLSGADNRGAHDFYTAMGFDPDEKLGFVKYRRYFGQ